MSSKRKNIVESLSVNKKIKQEEIEDYLKKENFINEYRRICNNTVGNYSERLKAFEELLPRVKKGLGNEHTFSIFIERLVGVCHFNFKNYVNAKEFFEESLPRYKKVWGNEHKCSLDIERMIGCCHLELKNNVKAKEIFEELLPRYKKAWGDENECSINIERLVGMCHLELKNNVKAKEIFEELLPRLNKVLGNENECSLDIEIQIYVCEREIDKIINKKKYTKLYEQALQNKNITLAQELLYKVDIECFVCMDKNSNIFTKCCRQPLCDICKTEICKKEKIHCGTNFQTNSVIMVKMDLSICPYCRHNNWIR